MIDLKKHTNIALGYFLLVGLLGVFLRFFYVTPIAANYRYIIHAHSHIALLGWVYIGLATLIYRLYFIGAQKQKLYLRIFWFTNITILGMLFTFPFQGYALFSITFSTLFLIASYFFAWFVIKKVPDEYRENHSYKCIRAALVYMVLSSIGPWALGGIMATLGSTSIWYKMAIYFYLHFQYNAWFVLALTGILFFLLGQAGLKLSKKDFTQFFWLINSGIILSFFLSVLWVEPPAVYYVLGAIGAVLQAAAFVKLYLILRRSWSGFQKYTSPLVQFLLKLTGVLLAGKILLQLLTGVPFFAGLSFLYQDFVIGYLHWVFLGVISIALFAFLHHTGLLRFPRPALWIYLTGFFISEALIFYKGLSIWQGLPFFSEYFMILVGISSLLPLSAGILLVNNFRQSPERIKSNR